MLSRALSVTTVCINTFEARFAPLSLSLSTSFIAASLRSHHDAHRALLLRERPRRTAAAAAGIPISLIIMEPLEEVADLRVSVLGREEIAGPVWIP